MSILKINTDGGARGNPGHAGIGGVAVIDSKIIFTFSEYIGITTNNVAEYRALIKALRYLKDNQLDGFLFKEILINLDSLLVVNQVKGIYKVKQSHLLTLKQDVISLINDVSQKYSTKISLIHVRRSLNKNADYLVNSALDAYLASS